MKENNISNIYLIIHIYILKIKLEKLFIYFQKKNFFYLLNLNLVKININDNLIEFDEFSKYKNCNC